MNTVPNYVTLRKKKKKKSPKLRKLLKSDVKGVQQKLKSNLNYFFFQATIIFWLKANKRKTESFKKLSVGWQIINSK